MQVVSSLFLIRPNEFQGSGVLTLVIWSFVEENYMDTFLGDQCTVVIHWGVTIMSRTFPMVCYVETVAGLPDGGHYLGSVCHV